MHFNKLKFDSEVSNWKATLKQRPRIAKDTVKGDYHDVFNFFKILLRSFEK